jgi:hypothetical protein
MHRFASQPSCALQCCAQVRVYVASDVH